MSLDQLAEIPWLSYAATIALVWLLCLSRPVTRTVEKTIDRVMTLVVCGFRFRPVRRDPQRTYNREQKTIIAARAGGRCEHKHPLWIRCLRPGAHADHIVPWSKGGPTSLDNAQLMCARHNLRKSALYPSPVYVWRLQRRRSRMARHRMR